MAYDYEFLKVDIDEWVATVRLDRPKVNALNWQVFDEIGNCATELHYDKDVRTVVFTGGPKVFAAGADIKEISGFSAAEATRTTSHAQEAINRLENIPKIVIAAINGYALGGGMEVALAADWRFMGETAKVGLPEILLGIIPGSGGTQRLARLIPIPKAKEMIYSGKSYDAKACLESGIADRVIEGDGEAVIAEAQKVAKEYATKFPPVALAMSKMSVNYGVNSSLIDGLALEAQSIAMCFSTEDQKIGMETFIKEGPGKAKFEGK
ncbi:MAG: enoyl-CoA hydratase/isomerase family protein [Actinobacteria bacterium]|nr:enoyl-CoA hydratase/isomerase family protein [Actinomycetota bacterium]